MIRPVLLWLSNSLIALGVVILVGTASIYGYSLYEQAQAEREVANLKPAVADAWTPVPAPSTTATPGPAAAPIATGEWASRSAGFVPWSERANHTPTVVPTPLPIYPAERIVAPSIRLDAKVAESPIVDGQWEIPKFAAGHLQGTAQPLQGSNVILAGHVQSISSGDVFANLDRLHAGDVIRLYTKASMISYKVEAVETVSNDDVQVLAPTSHEVLTLITCSGTWLPLQHDYSKRTVVVANRIT